MASTWGNSWGTSWADAWGAIGGGGGDPPAPAIAAELTDISRAFAQDMSPIHLEPHEWRQLKRIRHIAQRDERLAVAALRLFKKRATKVRAALRHGKGLHA